MTKKTLSERVMSLEINLTNICDDIHKLISNDLPHIQDQLEKQEDCLNGVRKDIVEVKTDVAWLKKFMMVIATASIGGLITGFFNLILK